MMNAEQVEAWGGGTSLDYLHFPELRGNESDLSLGQPSCLTWEGQLA